MLAGNTAVEECRQVAGGTLPLATSTCADYLGQSTVYTSQILQLGAPLNMAGCARATITACPAGYLFTYAHASNAMAVTACQASATCPANTLPMFNAGSATSAPTQIACGNTAACGATGIFGASAIPLRSVDGLNAAGCMAAAATACPTAFDFAIFATASGEAPKRTPQLTECWSSTPQTVSVACGTATAGSKIGDATVAVFEAATGGASNGRRVRTLLALNLCVVSQQQLQAE
jgi:hypothetical protein